MIALTQSEHGMTRQNIALTAYLISPLVVLVVLCYAIFFYLQQPPRMDVPPIGAGAGNTGGANAIGEQLAHGSSKSPGREFTGAGAQPGYEVGSKGPAPDGQGAQGASSTQPASGLIEPESLPQGVLIIVEDKSGKSSPSSPIYFAGNYTGWNPGDESFKMTPQSDMKWRILVKRPSSTKDRMEFKFTRGSWELEELNQDMSTPGNRTLPMIDASSVKDGEPPKFEFVVPHWGDARPEFAQRSANDPYRPLKVTGDVRRVQVAGFGATRGTPRDVMVWLPPGYDSAANANAKYPVIYLHDGQNLFEDRPGGPQEWKADEIATSLLSKRLISPVIIVAVPNSGATRNSEYMPIDAIPEIRADADLHVSWLLSEVMPRVERSFRIKTGHENTAIGGSSLGAAVSLYAASKHPETFGMVLAESLPLRTGNAKAWDDFTGSIKSWPRKVYLGMGGSETGSDPKNADRNKQYVTAIRDLEKTLDKAGLGADRKLLIVDDAAEHNEAAWSKRFPQALSFLFPPPMDGTK